MPIKVEPRNPLQTHHISLSDGSKVIGLIAIDSQNNASPRSLARGPIQRTALKTTSGEQTYSDLNFPWTPTSQTDFSGGRGNADFEDDTSRYYDSKRAFTLDGSIVHGPLEHFTKGYRSADFILPGSVTWSKIYGSRTYMAKPFSANVAYSAAYISLWIRRRGTPANALTVALCSDNSGDPGVVLQSTTVSTTTINDTISLLHRFAITAQALTQYTTYWIKVYSAGGTNDDHWEIGCSSVADDTEESAAGSIWTISDVDMYFRVTDADTTWTPLFFRYKSAIYMLKNATTGAPTLYINGDRGVADANTAELSKLKDATKGWTTDQFVGDVVWITGGTGVLEPQRWRTITANSATALTVDSDWTITHDTTTEYVIISKNIWTEYTTAAHGAHGLTGPVSSVLVVNNIVYFAQGEAIYMRRMKWEQSAGAEAYTWAADGTNYATYLCTVRNPSTGLVEVWRARNGSTPQVGLAQVQAWGTDLIFSTTQNGTTTSGSASMTGLTSTANLRVGMNITGTNVPANTTIVAITSLTALTMSQNATGSATNSMKFDNDNDFKDEWGQITGICEYGTTKYLWVFREGTIYALVSGRPDEIPLGELHTMMEADNGRANTPHNVYLYFSWGSGLERYYNSNLDDVGPNRDEGLPTLRQGVISKLVGYPNRLIAAIDAGATGYSSILMYNQSGWHEIYRSDILGARIRDMIFQTTPGTASDKLWFVAGSDILWLNFPSKTVDPTKDTAMEYTHEAVVESSWIYCNIVDIYKFYQSVKIFAEDLAEDAQYIEVDCKFDDDDDWTPLDDNVFTTPNGELFLNDDWGEVGKRAKYRIRSQTNSSSITPRTKTVVIETVSRVPVRYSFGFNYRIEDLSFDQVGSRDQEMVAEDIQKVLDDWAENLTPLTMRSIYSVFDNKRVFIDPIPLTPIADTVEKFMGKMNITVMKDVTEYAV